MIPRHYYHPSEAQRAELALRAAQIRGNLAAKRAARRLEQCGNVAPAERAFLEDLHRRASAGRFLP